MHLDQLQQLEQETFDFFVAEAKVVMNRRKYDRNKPLRNGDFALVKYMRKCVLDRIKKAEQDSKQDKSAAQPLQQAPAKADDDQHGAEAVKAAGKSGSVSEELVDEEIMSRQRAAMAKYMHMGMSGTDVFKQLQADGFPVSDGLVRYMSDKEAQGSRVGAA